jgi:hypothetical protein
MVTTHTANRTIKSWGKLAYIALKFQADQAATPAQ